MREIDSVEMVVQAIQDNLSSIFAYSMKCTGYRLNAEDLSQQIIEALLSSAGRLKEPEAIYGWLWSVARNTYRAWVRNCRRNQADSLEAPGIGLMLRCPESLPEEKVVSQELLNLLRRELALLSDLHRQVIVLYYVDRYSCTEIAQKLEISQAMVKTHLFKIRRDIREGMNMVRDYGEKSYQPSTLKLMGMYDDNSADYWRLFQRRLPGNLMLAVESGCGTPKELSIETGVPMVYLEDELAILEDSGLIERDDHGHLRNGMIIFTRETIEQIRGIFSECVVPKVNRLVDTILSEMDGLRAVGFSGHDRDKSRLLLTIGELLCFHLVEGLNRTEQGPLLKRGNHGWVWGLERDYDEWDWGTSFRAWDIFTFRAIDINMFHTNSNELFVYHMSDEMAALAVRLMGDGLVENDTATLSDSQKACLAELIEHGFAMKEEDTFRLTVPVFTSKDQQAIMDLLSEEVSMLSQAVTSMYQSVMSCLRSTVGERVQEQIPHVARFYVQSVFLSQALRTICTHRDFHAPNDATIHSIASYVLSK